MPTQPGYPLLSPGRKATDERDASLNHLDAPEHDRHRRLLAGEFTLRRMSAFRPVIDAVVAEAVTQLLAAGPPADLVAAFSLLVPAQVTGRLLGLDDAERPFFQSRSAVRMSLTATEGDVRTAHREIVARLYELVTRKRQAPQDDLIGRMAAHVSAGHLTEDELVDLVRLLLVNGYETTASMLSLGTVVLLTDPAAAAVARDGTDDEVHVLVDELLRYLTIVHLAPVRAVLSDIEVGGQSLRAGEGVILSLAAANRDADWFPEPDAIRPDRMARHHLAFGHGIHHCVGHILARLELVAAYRGLLRRLPGLRLTHPAGDLPYKTNSALYGVHRVEVTWDHR